MPGAAGSKRPRSPAATCAATRHCSSAGPGLAATRSKLCMEPGNMLQGKGGRKGKGEGRAVELDGSGGGRPHPPCTCTDKQGSQDSAPKQSTPCRTAPGGLMLGRQQGAGAHGTEAMVWPDMLSDWNMKLGAWMSTANMALINANMALIKREGGSGRRPPGGRQAEAGIGWALNAAAKLSQGRAVPAAGRCNAGEAAHPWPASCTLCAQLQNNTALASQLHSLRPAETTQPSPAGSLSVPRAMMCRRTRSPCWNTICGMLHQE